MAAVGGNSNTRVVGSQDLQRSVDSLNRVVQGLQTVVSKLPTGVQSVLSTVNTAVATGKGARNMVQDIFSGPQGHGKGYRYNWGNVGGNATFNGGRTGSPVASAASTMMGGSRAYLLGSPGVQGSPTGVMSAGMANGGGARFSNVPASGTAGGAPPIDLSGLTAIGGSVSKGLNTFAAMGAGMASSGATSDWAIRRMMMSNRQSWNANSNFAFGPSSGLGGWNSIATSQDDVASAMMINQNVSGSSIGRFSAGAQFMRGAAGLAYGNPTLSATGAAQYTAAMYSPRGIMMSAAYGMPTVGMNGQRATPSQQVSMLLQNRNMANMTPAQIDTALRTGYGLDASVNTLAGATGQDPALMKQQIRSQTAIATANGINVSQAGTVLERASQGDKAAISQVRKGLGDEQSSSVLQSMKTADAASRKTDQQILEGFTESLTKATDVINNLTSGFNKFLHDTGLDKIMGGMGAIGTSVKTPFGLLGMGIGALFSGGKQTDNATNAVGGGAGAISTSPTSAAKKGPTPSTGSTAQKFIDAAKKYLGQPYVFGGLDCSGLVEYAYKSVTGKTLPHRATSQYYMAQQVPKGKEQPGDTVYWDASTGRAPGNPTSGKGYKHHTAIYLGGGKIIAAPQSGENVKIQNLWGDYEFGRLPGVGGAVTAGGNPTGSNTDTTQTNQGGDTGANQAVGGLGGAYGSIDEYDALAAALAGQGANGSQPQNTNQSAQTQTPVGSSTGDSGGTTSNTAPMSADAGKAALQAMVKAQMKGFGWTSATDWNDINYIVEHESSWNPKSVNSIGAYGLFQAYPGSKMAAYGNDWKTNPVTQTKFGLNYIKSRYGDPVKAQAFWAKNRWYDNGAWEIQDTQTATVHKGEMILNKNDARTVRQALVANSISPSAAMGGGGGVTILFDKGAINVNNSAVVMNDEVVRNLAREIGQQVSQDNRITKIAKGN